MLSHAAPRLLNATASLASRRINWSRSGSAASGLPSATSVRGATLERRDCGGGKPQRLAVVGDGALELARGEIAVAAVDVGGEEFPVDADRLARIRDGTGMIAFLRPGERPVAVGGGHAGREPDGPIIVGDRLVGIAVQPIRIGAVEIDVRIVRIEPFGRRIVGECVLEIILALPQVAAVEVGVGVARLEADHLPVVAERAFELALVAQRERPIEEARTMRGLTRIASS